MEFQEKEEGGSPSVLKKGRNPVGNRAIEAFLEQNPEPPRQRKRPGESQDHGSLTFRQLGQEQRAAASRSHKGSPSSLTPPGGVQRERVAALNGDQNEDHDVQSMNSGNSQRNCLPEPVLMEAPRSFLPKVELPSFKGEKGALAEVWLTHLTRFKRLYSLSEGQMVELARISCKGEYASLWASMLPDEVSYEDFVEAFRGEFVKQNPDRLTQELLEKRQTGTVGKYATEIMQIFKALDTPKKEQVRHFCRGRKFGIKEAVSSSEPKSLLEAIRRAKLMEETYDTETNKSPLGSAVQDINTQVQKNLREGLDNIRFLLGSDVRRENFRPGPRSGPALNNSAV